MQKGNDQKDLFKIASYSPQDQAVLEGIGKQLRATWEHITETLPTSRDLSIGRQKVQELWLWVKESVDNYGSEK